MATGGTTPMRFASPQLRSTTDSCTPATMFAMGSPLASFEMTSDSANTVHVEDTDVTASDWRS